MNISITKNTHPGELIPSNKLGSGPSSRAKSARIDEMEGAFSFRTISR